MRKIRFPVDSYSLVAGEYKYDGEGLLGMFELLWLGVQKSPYGTRQGEQLSRKQHKVIKGLKTKLKNISEYKDSDQDSRILIQYEPAKPIEMWLENDEYGLLIQLLEANSFSPMVSETLTDLYELLDQTQEEELTPKLSD